MSIIPDSIPNALTSPGFFTAFEPSRMVVENSALALATPLLVRQQRTSQGHPILMVTGALSTNIGTNQMRRVLTRIGHHPHTPPNTTMFHKPMRILEIVQEETEKLYEQYREPITLAGWCMGGVFTRMTAQAIPDKVRQVINMGTARTAVWYPKELKSAAEPLPVPSTVIYSRTDGMTYGATSASRRVRRSRTSRCSPATGAWPTTRTPCTSSPTGWPSPWASGRHTRDLRGRPGRNQPRDRRRGLTERSFAAKPGSRR